MSSVVRKYFICAALFTASVEAHADRSVPMETYLENKRALKAVEKGHSEEALLHTGKAQAKNPALPELRYNQGVIQSLAGQEEQAEKGLDGAVKESLKEGDYDLAARARFNQGELYRKANPERAAKAYLDAIRYAKRADNDELEYQARKNLELLAKNSKKQKQDQKGSGESNPNDKNGGEQQNSSGGSGEQNDPNSKSQNDPNKKDDGKGKDQDPKDKKDGEGKDENQDQNPGQMRTHKMQREFKSEKLSKNAADQVMSELASREKELQRKLKQAKGTDQARPEKDW